MAERITSRSLLFTDTMMYVAFLARMGDGVSAISCSVVHATEETERYSEIHIVLYCNSRALCMISGSNDWTRRQRAGWLHHKRQLDQIVLEQRMHEHAAIIVQKTADVATRLACIFTATWGKWHNQQGANVRANTEIQP